MYYSTSRLVIQRPEHYRERQVNDHMSDRASDEWRLVTASFWDKSAKSSDSIPDFGIEYIFFWEREDQPPSQHDVRPQRRRPSREEYF